MPEDPEVKHIADVLNQDLSNKKIISIKHHDKSRYREKQFPNQNNIVEGTKIKYIYARSKKIVWVLETPDNREIYMVSFLAIHGHWLYKEAKCTRLSFQLEDRTVYYDDQDNKGTIQVYLNIHELEDAYKNIGLDLLGENININDYKSTIRNGRIKTKTISSFLLEQKYFSGIGNIYRSEILYYTGIHPLRELQSLTDTDIELIYKTSIYILSFAYKCGGVSVMSYIDPNGTKGTYSTVIYGKEITTFGHKVSTMIENERKIYFAPEIQK